MSLLPIQVNMDVQSSDQSVPMDVQSTDQSVPMDPSTDVEPIINRNYNALDNKPAINGVELSGNKTFEELGEMTITNAELLDIINEQYHMVFGGLNA